MNEPLPEDGRAAVRAAVASSAPDLDPALVDGFVSRMSAAYLQRHPPAAIARHARLSADVDQERRARVEVAALGDSRHEVVVAALDYFGEFAILCGLLSVHGLVIEAGEVNTMAPAAVPPPVPGRRRSPPPSTKIVDIFKVAPRPGKGPPDARRLEEELRGLLDYLADGLAQEARERLNRKIVEALETAQGELLRSMAPVDIEFDNAERAAWTVMRVRGKDSPAFLYMLANALVMRDIYVDAVRIESRDGFVHDEFKVAHRDGRKVEREEDQQVLRVAVVLIKQFSHFLPSAPDPARALRSFDQLLDRVMAMGGDADGMDLFRGEEGLRSLALLLGSSEFLWEDFLRRHLDHLLPVLGGWRDRPLRTREELSRDVAGRLGPLATFDERMRSLNQWRDEEMLVVDLKRLLDPEVSLERFSRALADLGEAFIEAASELCGSRLIGVHGQPRRPGGAPCPHALFGLGKFGGRELGYASDLELLFVYGGDGQTARDGLENGVLFERLVQDLVESVAAPQEGMFHLDLRLRPHGSKGPLASPMKLLRDYYRPGGDAHPFERQALIKLRYVAGDETLGREVEALRDAFVWSGEAWDHAEALRLRERQVTELVPAGRFNVKLSRGGLVDVEYAVQYLQIQYGKDHPELRTPTTLEALGTLGHLGFVEAPDRDLLAAGYVFWRRVADALRMVRGQAGDLLLPDEGSQDLRLLARRLGYEGKDWAAAAAALDADIDRHRLAVRSFFDRRFGAAR